jgi:hypothetical protein
MTDKYDLNDFLGRSNYWLDTGKLPPDGPWANEFHELQWVDLNTRYQCFIKRNFSGVLCGYVRIPFEHPCHGMYWENLPDDVLVHGGITYSARHFLPDSDDGWVFGFDCGHGFDVMPCMPIHVQIHDTVSEYRNMEYVKAETESLAKQLKNLHNTEC